MNGVKTPSKELPQLTIVLAVHDQAEALRRNLPQLLSQNYEAGYTVVVVDESSTDDTEDVLIQLKAAHANLYTSFIPKNSHYVSRRKLALTVGIKAAKSEWIIICEAGCHPENSEWLAGMAAELSGDAYDLVCAYTPYVKGTKGRYAFLRLLTAFRQGRSPYRYDGACIALRKSVFMERNGFLKNLPYLRGEFDFLVNETPADRVTMVISDNPLRQDEPTKKEWTNGQTYYMQHRNRLKRAFLKRCCFVLYQLLLHAVYWLLLAAIIYAILKQQVLIIAIATVLIVLLAVMQTLCLSRLARRYAEYIGWWKLAALDLGVAWHYARYWLRYLSSNKYDFIRK